MRKGLFALLLLAAGCCTHFGEFPPVSVLLRDEGEATPFNPWKGCAPALPGDEIWTYGYLSGPSGYALVRNGTIVDYYQIKRGVPTPGDSLPPPPPVRGE